MVPTIWTFEDRFGARTLAEHAFRNPGTNGSRLMPTDTVAVGPAVQARVDHGRWIADCPDLGCQGAELVSFDNPVFFCCACRNASVGGNLLPVLVPGPQKRRSIEVYLRARPVPDNRNWFPNETVAELRDQNRSHHLDLLPEDR